MSATTGSASGVRPRLGARAAFGLVLIAAAVAGFAVTGHADGAAAVAAAGPELTRLLRGMAAIKTGFAGAALAAVWWRLRAPVRPARLAAYALAAAAMAAGPGLIWSMAHVGLGALLLHGGLAATVLLLWRDPAVGALLEHSVLRRRVERR